MPLCSNLPQVEGSSFQPIAYDIATASRVSSIGKTRLYELIAEGRLESRHIGRRRVILADSLRALIYGD